MLLRTAIVATALIAGIACQRQSTPDPRIDELNARLLELKARQGTMETLLERLEAAAEAGERARASTERTTATAPVEAGRIDEIAAKLDRVEERVEALAAAPTPTPAPPVRKTPDANAVYSVPIKGAPYTGPRHAKVTIIQGFEFA